MGWGVSKRTLSDTWSSLFLSASLHVKTETQSNRQKHDTLHQRSLTLLGSFFKWGALREMWEDRIKPHEISLSENVCAQITIRVESLTSSAVNKDAFNTNVSSQTIHLDVCEFRNVFNRLWLRQSELKWTEYFTAVSHFAINSICEDSWRRRISNRDMNSLSLW